MEVQRIDHMHGWTDDADRLAKLFREVFEMTTEVYNFDQFGARTAVIRVGEDNRFIEFVQPKDPSGEMWKIGRPGTPGVFGVNLKVANMDQAIAELTARGIRLIRDRKGGNTRQAWFDTENTFGIQIELSEYAGDSLIGAAGIAPPEKV